MLPGAEHTVSLLLSVGGRDAHYPAGSGPEEVWELGRGGWEEEGFLIQCIIH